MCSALWLLRLRRCPPLPLKFLVQPEEILKGTKNILWGLLLAVKSTTEAPSSSSSLEETSTSLLTPGYSPDQLRLLNLSILQVLIIY